MAEPVDAELLTRFVQSKDEAAFAEILRRHGPLVWGVCWRALANSADAEDAFQATFLVLFQRAGRINQRTSLASWLYGVALRVTRRARSRASRRREVVMAGADERVIDALRDEGLALVLDAELRKLPARYREPVILCHLQGQTQSAAAQLLGWPVGTVAGRLSRAKELLRSRLVRRGVAPGVVTATIGEVSTAAVPAGLMDKMLEALRSGPSVQVGSLAKGMVLAMQFPRVVVIGSIVLGLCLGLGVGYGAYAGRGIEEFQEKTTPASKPADAKPMHPDYALLEGHWRSDSNNPFGSVEELIFRGTHYSSRIYVVEEGKFVGNGVVLVAGKFELHPEETPKRIDFWLRDTVHLLKFGPKMEAETTPAMQLGTYAVQGNELRVNLGGYLMLRRQADRTYVIDREGAGAKYPDLPKENAPSVKVYRRVSPRKPVENPAPSDPNRHPQELKLLNERIEAAEETVRLRHQAYRAGKETVDFMLQAIKTRAEAKLDRDGTDPEKKRAILGEAHKSLSEAENIAVAKYRAGSATLLEVTIVKQERLENELKLLRHDLATKKQ